MDRIEPVDGSLDPSEGQRPSSAHLSTPEAPAAPTSYLRPRAPSLRPRRPSIRIQRPPSFSGLNLQGQRNVGSTSNLISNFDNNAQKPRRKSNFGGSEAAGNVQNEQTGGGADSDGDAAWQGRRRSSSEPRPGHWSRPDPFGPPRVVIGDQTNAMPMYSLKEESSSPQSPVAEISSSQPFVTEQLLQPTPPMAPRPGNRNMLRRTSEAALNRFSRNRASTVNGTMSVTPPPNPDATEYRSQIVDVLDVIDPEVSALSTLTNVQNSLFIPNLGTWVNRMPTYTLSPPRPRDQDSSETESDESTDAEKKGSRPTLQPSASLSSVLDESPERRFAVLPEEMTLEGWTKEEVEELNDRVRHMLHSRRSAFKRAMVGFGKYVSKPLGFLVTLYATLITLFGLAWVLFLIGWINVGGKQLYVINVIDNVLVALFAIMGDGLAPFRAVDTYHMIFIARYTFLTWKIRQKRALPALKDKNDLPARPEAAVDVEYGNTPFGEEHEFSVLNCAQQLKLIHHQEKFAKSHTFYKPHETPTHHAFPLRLLVAIVVLLDCHSLFQIALGACTWGISYHVRPFALTTVILCCSLTCNITGGILIMIGDRRTRKKDVVERLFRQQLTEQAVKKMQKKKRKEEERKSMDQERKSFDFRKSFDQSRRSLDLRKSMDQSRRPLDHSRSPSSSDPTHPGPYQGT
ncbi:uncharacterized protein ACLA_010370 [Aspergillus clavatus NRRL 1]|uniref:Integral membrane protein n=1 Tax=Aspergillus clavatus (strain ATCC 1007 / CBS 513.65 / DSM 816 / NCTC 3887 / NRRL 1 / QM 1276 / 107) TaxID=344612 RepID=A1CA43_ASPCL|nr:uncharacterized protein ACLA_010370 [Aspergillus clavatus NRRL 1]EAW12611.1 integral membrane protein [Aspergillus clavatus NRRL 1]